MAAITEVEIQTMWTNVVDILEKHRAYADATATSEGELETLVQSLRGEYAPSVAPAADDFRALISAPLTQDQVLSFLEPLVFEYGKFISENALGGQSGTGQGAGADFVGNAQTDGVMRAIYEHMRDINESVETRDLSYDLTADTSNNAGTGLTGGPIVGNGSIQRLTVDAEAEPLEACAVERKTFRCTADQNTGTKQEGEIFAAEGEKPPLDTLGKNTADVLGQLGSGSLLSLRALHAGSSDGGSKLTNSSFSTYDANATPKFDRWDLTSGTAADVTQDLTNTYRQYPNSTISASLKIASSVSDTKTLKQTLSNMRIARLDPNVPYFCRMMVNVDDFGSLAVGGDVVLRVGSKSVTESIVTLDTTGGWVEMRIGDSVMGGAERDQWPINFNEDGFDIEIEWTQSTSTGDLNIDDVIFAPYTLIDGTWWAIRQDNAAPASWKMGDTLEFTDTYAVASTDGLVQYWNYRAGLGSLPSSGTPTWSEPA